MKSIEVCGGYAFACDSENQTRQEGMTLRDWFAGQVLGQCACNNGYQDAAVEAYAYADAMLKVRMHTMEGKCQASSPD